MIFIKSTILAPEEIACQYQYIPGVCLCLFYFKSFQPPVSTILLSRELRGELDMGSAFTCGN